MRRLLDFIHKAQLLWEHSSEPAGRFHTWAVLKGGEWWDVQKPPRLFGPDEWVLKGGRTVNSCEIVGMMDRGDLGY